MTSIILKEYRNVLEEFPSMVSNQINRKDGVLGKGNNKEEGLKGQLEGKSSESTVDFTV